MRESQPECSWRWSAPHDALVMSASPERLHLELRRGSIRNFNGRPFVFLYGSNPPDPSVTIVDVAMPAARARATFPPAAGLTE